MERKLSQATVDFNSRRGSQVTGALPQVGEITTTPSTSAQSSGSVTSSPPSPSTSTSSVPVPSKRTVSMLTPNNNSTSPTKVELNRGVTTQAITRPTRSPSSKMSVADFLSASPSNTGKWSKKKIEIRDGVLYKYRAADAELELSASLLGAEMKAFEPDKIDNAFSLHLLSTITSSTSTSRKGKNITIILKCPSPEEMQMWITVCLKSSFPASALQSQTNEDKLSILEFAAVLKEAEIQASSWKDLASKLKLHLEKKNWEKEWNVLEDREMKKLPSSFSEATKDDNKLKNRYLNVLPLDKTRVKVSPISNDPISTDYVNANFVKVKVKFEYLIIEKSGNRIYIASQAPLPNTFGDFFRMIWENNCEIIIMLTRWIENGKLKASNYIPEEPEEEDYDGMKVKIIQVEKTEIEDVVLTILQLKKEEEIRQIKHLHYIGWPDHGTLEKSKLETLLNFVDQKLQEKKSIQVVHCSAGIGRTGTWIIAKFLQEEIANHLKEGKKVMPVNMMQLLDFFRSQRSGTLTHSDQYLFLYHFLIDESLKAAAFEQNQKLSTTTTTTTTSTSTTSPNSNPTATTATTTTSSFLDPKKTK